MNDFDQLQSNIVYIHSQVQTKAIHAINQALTLRNWLIGMYIVEFEQNGENRAQYGTGLMSKLAKSTHIKGLSAPEFSRCRQFYLCYPEILGTVTQEFKELLPKSILGTASQELLPQKSVVDRHKISRSRQKLITQIITKLSYSHIVELIKVSDDIKRTFYEIETIKGTWSVRELKRQIASLYYERTGLSAKPEKLSEITQAQISPQAPADIIKNIYAFEFLDISNREAIEEADLETALLDNLQAFILEMGNGFCFEYRQKKILIGSDYNFIDMVFYHRILKCHVIIELKVGAFEHGDIGQLNTYLNYYKEEILEESDNDPVGILLVAEKNHALVKYATAGMDENLFVQQYLIQLPSKNQLEAYINNELRRLI